MSRFAAFSCLTACAFAWVPPGIDRAGLAALGLAFTALSVGRAVGVARPATFRPKPPALLAEPHMIEPLTDEALEHFEQLGRAARERDNGEGSTGFDEPRIGLRIPPK